MIGNCARLFAPCDHLRGMLQTGVGDLGAAQHAGHFVSARGRRARGCAFGYSHPSSALAAPLNVLAQGEVHAGLIAVSLSLEPVNHVGINAQ